MLRLQREKEVRCGGMESAPLAMSGRLFGHHSLGVERGACSRLLGARGQGCVSTAVMLRWKTPGKGNGKEDQETGG